MHIKFMVRYRKVYLNEHELHSLIEFAMLKMEKLANEELQIEDNDSAYREALGMYTALKVLHDGLNGRAEMALNFFDFPEYPDEETDDLV